MDYFRSSSISHLQIELLSKTMKDKASVCSSPCETLSEIRRSKQTNSCNDFELTIKRLYSNTFYGVYTAEEEEATKDFSSFTKSYLIKRKTILFLALIVRMIDLLISLITFGFSIEESFYLEMTPFLIMIILIDSLMLIENVIVLVMNHRIYKSWTSFGNSINYSKLLAGIIMIIPIVIAGIPVYNEIRTHHEINDIKEDEMDLLFDITIVQIASSILPVITNAQNFIMSSNVLITELKNTFEIRLIKSISLIIYLPIYLTAIVLLYNITVDYIVLIAGILYIIYLTLPFIQSSQNSSIVKIIEWLFVLGILALLIGKITRTDINTLMLLTFIGIIIESYINYILMSIVMIDLVFYYTIRYRIETSELIDLFDIIIQDTQPSEASRVGFCEPNADTQTPENYKKIPA